MLIMSDVKIVYLVLLNVLMWVSVRSQVTIDSVFIVDTVHHLFKNSKPSHTYPADIQPGVSTFLSSIASAQLQQSSPGGLTTLLHRGMGTRHLPVLWEGINIQSMVNGSFDLSLIPLHLYSGTQFYSFGSPTLTGSNAIAGALNISTNPHDRQSLIGIQLSSLENVDLLTKYTHQGSRYSGTLGADLSIHQNSYTYTFNKQKENRIGTNQLKYNLLYNSTYYLSKNQAIRLGIWSQASDREIPSGVTSAHVSQQQKDSNNRFKAGHTFLFAKSKFNTWISYMDENIRFSTPVVDSRSNVKIYSSGTEFSSKKEFIAKITYRKDVVDANFFSDIKVRSQLNLASSKMFKVNRYKLFISARQDYTDNRWMPFSFTGSVSHEKMSLQVSRNYNLPGFNDLYWPVSGNNQLKTEISHQAELKHNIILKGLKVQSQLYMNYVKDWIQWIPTSNGLWSPLNQKTVLSRGFECHVSKEWNTSTTTYKADIEYHYNRTSASDHYFEKELVGKQLIYVPQHTFTSGFLIKKKKHTLYGNFRFTGIRSYTPDNQYHLSPYYIIDLFYKYTIGDKADVTASIQNLTNHQYQIVRFFPLPGISGNILFKLYFKHK
jgi:hypothetical protein